MRALIQSVKVTDGAEIIFALSQYPIYFAVFLQFVIIYMVYYIKHPFQNKPIISIIIFVRELTLNIALYAFCFSASALHSSAAISYYSDYIFIKTPTSYLVNLISIYLYF